MSLELIAPDGTRLDLAPGTKVQLNLKNSAFDEQVLRGSFSYSFSLPLTDKNRLFFGFPDQISANAGYVTDYDNFILKSGLIEFLVRLKIQSVGIESISINLFTASGIFADYLKNTKLRELDYGSINIPIVGAEGNLRYSGARGAWQGGSGFVTLKVSSGGNLWLHGYPIDGITRQVALKKLCDRINQPPVYVQAWNSSTQYFAYKSWVFRGGRIYQAIVDNINIDPDSIPGDDNWQDIGSEANYVTVRNSKVWDYWWFYDDPADPKDYFVFPLYGYMVFSAHQIDSDDLLATDISPLDWRKYIPPVLEFMLKKAYEDPREGSVKFFPVRDEEFTSEKANLNCINFWKDGAFVNEFAADSLAKVHHSTAPMLRVLFILEKIFENLNIGVLDENVLSNDFLKILVAYSNTSNEKIFSITEALRTENVDVYNSFLKLNEFTPDCTLADFLNGFRSLFFLGTWFDFFRREIKLKPLKEVLADYQNAIELTDLVANFQDIFIEVNDGFELLFTHDSGDSVANEKIKILDQENITLKDPVPDFASLPTNPDFNDVRLVEDLDSYFIAQQDKEGDYFWEFFSYNLQELKIGNAKATYTAKAAGLPNFIGNDSRDKPSNLEIPDWDDFGSYLPGDYVNDEGVIKRAIQISNSSHSIDDQTRWEPLTPYKWIVPFSGFKRKSWFLRQKDECSFRVIPYTGVRQNPYSENPDDVYPLACNDPYERLGAIFPGRGGSVKWEGQYGIYEQWGKEWIDFLSKSKSASIQIKPSEEILNKLKPWLLVKIKNHYFMWSEMKVNLPLGSDLLTIKVHLV